MNIEEINKLNTYIDELVLSNKEKLNIIEESKIKIQDLNSSIKKKSDEVSFLKETITKLELSAKKLVTQDEYDKMKINLMNRETIIDNLKKKIEESQMSINEKDKRINVSLKKVV